MMRYKMEENKYFCSVDDFTDIFKQSFKELGKGYVPSKLDIKKTIKIKKEETVKKLNYTRLINGKKEKAWIKFNIPKEIQFIWS